MDSDPESSRNLLQHHYISSNNNNPHHHHHNNPPPHHPYPHQHPHHPYNHNPGKPSLYPSVPPTTTPTPTTTTTTTTSPLTHKPEIMYSNGGEKNGYGYPTGGQGQGQGQGVTLTQNPAETLLQLQRRVARLTSYLYGLAITVGVAAILTVALVTALYAKLAYDVRHHSHQPKVGEQISKILEREELCVKCNEVRLGPSPDEEAMLDVFTKRESRDGLRCCVERPAELLRLLELHHDDGDDRR
ncbi:hypothetical protein ACOMHN_013771 [Nucella lapillus]